ncbi:MAG: zf-HC2 domain-containing protein [Candidatus Omnitrophica bacterium]|nr:zf-HC2 domain-containing protein [Candidatus Omnitrophota bacterium]
MTVSSRERLSCREIRPRLSSYARGRLSLPETRMVYAHLTGCGICRLDVEPLFKAKSRRTFSVTFFTVPAAVAVTAFFTLPLLSNAHLSGPSAATVLRPAPTGPVPLSSGKAAPRFLAKPNRAYYIRLKSGNPYAEDALDRLLFTSRLLEMRGPYAGRYYLTATASQLTELAGRMADIGKADVTEVGPRRWWGKTISDPDSCSVTVDLTS